MISPDSENHWLRHETTQFGWHSGGWSSKSHEPDQQWLFLRGHVSPQLQLRKQNIDTNCNSRPNTTSWAHSWCKSFLQSSILQVFNPLHCWQLLIPFRMNPNYTLFMPISWNWFENNYAFRLAKVYSGLLYNRHLWEPTFCPLQPGVPNSGASGIFR